MTIPGNCVELSCLWCFHLFNDLNLFVVDLHTLWHDDLSEEIALSCFPIPANISLNSDNTSSFVLGKQSLFPFGVTASSNTSHILIN